VISPSDPCSAWTAKANKRVQFGYGLNCLIDMENAVIVNVEPTPARTYDEVDSTKTMLARFFDNTGGPIHDGVMKTSILERESNEPFDQLHKGVAIGEVMQGGGVGEVVAFNHRLKMSLNTQGRPGQM
jgi:hypothetical protein